MTADRKAAGELALTMADADARHGDLRQALKWLDVYAEREQLPRSYEEKRRGWVQQMRGERAGTEPRHGRRSPSLEPLCG